MKSKFSNYACIKVEKILKCSLDSIPSPSPSVKIQILTGVRENNFLFYFLFLSEGGGIEPRLHFKIFSTLLQKI